ncbi:hypothetical protein EPA93_26330 [Ktedonosporobacter rubrisoli]|uniref:Peptidase MA-like domain-containing protein n=1 Tax=Ktedonosporobacter rubrisoli TaxID=2509675 RepID=A0A4P6JUY9_KTERU|nr:peptidase MA family metallohydrolase [Ktedonosporobacter rubrisoli]QBD79314.1 hypothetical protein EPA93_26330 [Ktedonosporobacter rubrisoli]
MLTRPGPLLRLFVVCMLGGVLSPALAPSHAYAFSDPITINSQTDTINFPSGIDFQVSARDSTSPIVRATIFIASSSANLREEHQVNVTDPSQQVTLRWHEDTTGNHFTPPGTQISYHWALQDQLGNLYTGIIQHFSVIDTRYNWQQISDGMLQVHWYNRTVDFGKAVLHEADAHLKRISANLGGGLVEPVDLWIYASNDDFHGSLAPQTYEWVGGISFPELDQASIVVDSLQAETLSRDMPHEMTHLVFHQLIARGILAPLWLDEGLAVYNQVYHEPAMKMRFKQALAEHNLLRLDDIANEFPADANKAYLAYAESWMLVDYMYHTFGPQKIAALIKGMDNPQNSFRQDLLLALDEDQIHLENQWLLHLNQPPILNPSDIMSTPQPNRKPIQVKIMPDSNAPLLLALGIALVTISLMSMTSLLVYQRRNRQSRQQLRRDRYGLNQAWPSSFSTLQRSIPSTDPMGSALPPQQRPWPVSDQYMSSAGPYASSEDQEWPPRYPPARDAAEPFVGNDPNWPRFTPGQEYPGSYPNHQVPQE